ncbi:MAG: 3-deoxy-manno-octulosonate cytidylyltransferase [Sphingomonadaceae bacterium]|nr:3-deoxy-manno-octulosonate cytidylyltransferase [Sphingomonadaceae bacterium]
MKTVAIIPARWESTRFPGKPLAEIAGQPMIQHVWEKASAARGVHEVIIATDSDRIAAAAASFGAQAIKTRKDHESGSDRLAEVAQDLRADVIINVQGDEPLVRSSDLENLAALMVGDDGIEVASLCHPITAEEAANPNRVKVVCDAAGDALYFSRAAIPHPRAAASARYRQHIGVYAYRRETLLRFPDLPVPTEERAEALEQLRFLSAGIPIRLIETEPSGPGVDVPEDIARVEALMKG